jgi:hypothetical protein
VTGTPLSCHRSISIVADERLEVRDGAYWAFVMKKGKGRIAEATVTSPPKRSLDGAPSGLSNNDSRAGQPPHIYSHQKNRGSEMAHCDPPFGL